MKRTLVVGDIHGGYKALIQVLERANVTTEDKLIFLGDYVDGWSESAELITYLITLQKQQECIFIKGNHDVWCWEWLLDHNNENFVWFGNGGKETVLSYEKSTVNKEERR